MSSAKKKRVKKFEKTKVYGKQGLIQFGWKFVKRDF